MTLRPAGPRGLGGMEILGKAIRNVHSWDFADVDVLANDRFAPQRAPSLREQTAHSRSTQARPDRRGGGADCLVQGTPGQREGAEISRILGRVAAQRCRLAAQEGHPCQVLGRPVACSLMLDGQTRFASQPCDPRSPARFASGGPYRWNWRNHTSFAPETTSPKRNECDRTRRKHIQRTLSIFCRS